MTSSSSPSFCGTNGPAGRRDSRKLIVTPYSEEDTTVCISTRFRQRGIIAEVVEMVGNQNEFLVTFLESSTARKVYNEKELYELRSVRVNFAPRAGPNTRVKYKVLSDVLLYNGKSSKASCIGKLKRGDRVTANQLKKRRVRLVEGQEIIGWANLFTENNDECMLQLEE